MNKVGPLKPFNTIGPEEAANVLDAMERPLSGYLGGVPKGGYWVERLADEWCQAFGCKYATPCNSATSGLLAACMAADIKPGDPVWVTSYSMSATAACAIILGAKIRFLDIERRYFCANPYALTAPGHEMPKALIVTNLFGHPAMLSHMRRWCDDNDVVMIEDNAQAPFATEGGRYAGTVGHIGVFSLNVHKHIQCGEGGVIVSDSDDVAAGIAGAINHGELGDHPAGLNLRMVEVTAAIACAQLKKGPAIVTKRIEIAQELSDMIRYNPLLKPPQEREGCKHVYYLWAAMMRGAQAHLQIKLASALNRNGFPALPGYSYPLHRLFKSENSCLVADEMERLLITYENCAYTPTRDQMKIIRDVINQSTDEVMGIK